MVRVICDTSFILHIANTRIKNINSIDIDIGSLEYVVPTIVQAELKRLANISGKEIRASHALNHITRLQIADIGTGPTADDVILYNIKQHGGIVATLDVKLKHKVKQLGGSILSVSNDRIILEQ